MSEGIRELDRLVRSMNPELHAETYVFVNIPQKPCQMRMEEIQGCYRESEGMTFILDKETADRKGLTYSNTWRSITLRIHSDLEAVGFTAKISGALALAGIPCNMIAACYHDHIYVPALLADKAMNVLVDLQETKI